MDVLYAFILGAIQGFTEFIPISSSGHLSLVENMLGFDMAKEQGMLMTFDILIHLATAFGIIIFFMEDIWKLLTKDWKQTLYILLATIPLAIVGAFFTKFFEVAKSQPIKIGIGFVGTAIFLLGGEVFAVKKSDPDEKVKLLDAILIGIAQAAALMPGVSRSGSTIGSALICGVGREKAVKFSFILGIPAFLGAAVWRLYNYTPNPTSEIGLTAILIGTLTAFALTFVAIPLTIKIVKSKNLLWFSGYCFLLGVGTIVYEMMKS